MTSYKHSHDPKGRRPLRLEPLPRPRKPAAADSEPAGAAAEDESEPEGAAEPSGELEDAEAKDPGSDHSRGEWIHEWERPV